MYVPTCSIVRHNQKFKPHAQKSDDTIIDQNCNGLHNTTHIEPTSNAVKLILDLELVENDPSHIQRTPSVS